MAGARVLRAVGRVGGGRKGSCPQAWFRPSAGLSGRARKSAVVFVVGVNRPLSHKASQQQAWRRLRCRVPCRVRR